MARRKDTIYICEPLEGEDYYSYEEQWEMYDELIKQAGVEPAGQDVIQLWRIIAEKEARGAEDPK